MALLLVFAFAISHMRLVHPDCTQLHPLLSASHACKPQSLCYIHVLFFCFIASGVRSEMSEWPWIWSYCFEPGGLFSEENYSPSLRSHRQLIVQQERVRHHDSLPCPWPVVTMPIPLQVDLIASVITRPEVGDLPFSLSSGSYILSGLSSTMLFEP